MRGVSSVKSSWKEPAQASRWVRNPGIPNRFLVVGVMEGKGGMEKEADGVYSISRIIGIHGDDTQDG